MIRIRAPSLRLPGIFATVLVACGASTAIGQMPGVVPKPGAHAAQAPTPADIPPERDVDKLRAALDAAQAELERVATSPNQAIDAPPEATPSQLLIRLAMLRQLVRAHQQRIDDIATLERLRTQRATVDSRLARWRIDPERGKYSMVEVETLRRELQQCLRRIDAATARLESLDSLTEVTRFSARNANQAARRLLERIEARDGKVPVLIWERELQLLRGRVAVASLDALIAQRDLREEERAVARTDLDFLRSQLSRTDGKVEFSEKDRDSLLGGLDARLKSLEPELGVALAASETARKVFEQSRARLEAGRAPAAGDASEPDPARVRRERDAELAELRYTTAQARVNAVRLMIDLGESQRAAWGYWYDIVRSQDADNARQLNAVLDSYRVTVAKTDTATREAFRLTLSQMAAADREVVTTTGAESAFHRARRDTLGERADWQARLLGDVMSTADLLDRWHAGFANDVGQRGGGAGLEYGWHRAGVLARAVWDFELFSAQDTIEVEGRKIVAERSITLGKVFTAVLILVVGAWIARWAIRTGGALAVRHLKADANSVGLAGKWLFALMFVVLFLLSLMTVKIPFTVFAFLGGAVAIGVGFGMQTLLKNLISGMMLLIERPFRLGDTVEVGGVRGRIADINVRSSLIRDRNGIETLVPNSTFLEQNVTNWTYSSSRVRFALNVGVAYGSPTDRVRELLLTAAARHGLVQRDPAPEVFFEDFAADALAFSLQYWLNLAESVDARRVGSDLRFMIEKSFAEAGIGIAFPQRDVHLDAAQPIPVRIVEPHDARTGNRSAESTDRSGSG